MSTETSRLLQAWNEGGSQASDRLIPLLIRRILVDHARQHRAAELTMGDRSLLALVDALSDLEKVDPGGCKVVELHVFGGFELEEIPKILGVTKSAVLRDWKHAKLWLRSHLSSAGTRARLRRNLQAVLSDVEEARERHGELVDKKFAASLGADEEQELKDLEQLLDHADASIYEPVKQRLRAEIGRLSAQRGESDPSAKSPMALGLL